MDPNLVKAGRSKFEEEVSDSDNSGSDSDSTDDTDPLAAAAHDIGAAAQIPAPRPKFLSYKEVIQQKIDDLKAAGLLSQDFGYLDNDRALTFFQNGLRVY
ncbi:MAG UNVERIFIED_CONTAM: hypothetical protein LVQ98_03850 [Rickettsiaceae bacterium]|jgi:hypothetical protein